MAPPVAKVVITGVDSPALVGSPRTLRATAVGTNGKPITGAAVTWGVVDTTTRYASVSADSTTGDATLTPRAVGTVTITATSRGVTGRATLTVRASEPGIAISVSPTSVAPEQGGTDSVTVTLVRSGGFVGAVTVAVTGLSIGVTASALTFGVGVTSATLTLTTASDARIGNATLTLTASGAGVASATTTLALSVTAATVVTGGGGGDVGTDTLAAYGVAALAGFASVPFRKPNYIRPPIVEAGTTYYIDAAGGNDGANGLTAGTAWKTLSKITSVAGGSTVLVWGAFADGDYCAPPSGTVGGWTVIRKRPGFTMSCYGDNQLGSFYPAFYISTNRCYISLEGLTITPGVYGDSGSCAFSMAAGAHHIHLYQCTVQGTYVSGNLSATKVGSTTVLGQVGVGGVSDIYIDGCHFDVIGTPPEQAGNAGDCLYILGTRVSVVRTYTGRAGHTATTLANGTTDCLIADNEVANDWAGGIILNGDQTNTRNVVEWNALHDMAKIAGNVGSRMGIECQGYRNVLRYNFIRNIAGPGIQLQAYPFQGTIQTCMENVCVHNTVTNTDGYGIQLFVSGEVNDPTFATADLWCKSMDGLVANNVVYNAVRTITADEGALNGIVVDLYHASEAEWNAWTANDTARGLNGHRLRHNSVGVAVPPARVGGGTPIFFGWIGKNPYGHDNSPTTHLQRTHYYTSATEFETEFPSCDGNTFQVDPQLTSVTVGAENAVPQPTSPLIGAGLVLTGYAYTGSAPTIGQRVAG